MDIINYFKIKCLVDVIATEKAKEIFKSRYTIESGGMIWKNIPAYGQFFISNFPDKDRLRDFHPDILEIINSGNLDNFPFLLFETILSISQFNKINKEIFNKQKNLLKEIKEIYNKNILDNITFKISDEKFNQLKIKLIELIEGLSNKESTSTLPSSINNLEYLLDTLQNEENKNIVDLQNEKKAKEIKERGNRLHSDGSFKMAFATFLTALEIPGISVQLKSILNLNVSTALYEYNRIDGIERNLQYYTPNNEDYRGVIKAREHALISAGYRPSWNKPYYRVGFIMSKLSQYQLAIDFYEASLILDGSEENQKFIQPLIEDSKSKLSIINRSLNKDGSRNIPKEIQLVLNEKLGIKQIMENNKLDDQFIKSLLSKVDRQLKNDLLSKGVEENLATLICIKDQLAQRSLGIDKSSRKAGKAFTNSEYSQFILAMLIKCALCPSSLDLTPNKTNIKCEVTNYESVGCAEQLGRIFRHGTYNQDIDMLRAKYYFEKVILSNSSFNDNQAIARLDGTGFSYYALGHMYTNSRFLDDTFFQPFDIANPPNLNEKKKQEVLDQYKKGCNYFKMGSKLFGTEFNNHCIREYQRLGPQYDPSYGSSNVQSLDYLSKEDEKRIAFTYGRQVFEDDFKEFREPIELIKIKNEMESGSEYSKQMYQVFLDIDKFIQDFNKYSKEIPNNNKKNQLIKSLADLYCKVDLFYLIRFPPREISSIIEFIGECYKEQPNDLMVIICYLGVHRFDIDMVPKLLKIIKKAEQKINIGLPKNSFKNQYYEVLGYFKCVFLTYDGKISDSLTQALEYDVSYNNTLFFFNHNFYHLGSLLLSVEYEQESITTRVLKESLSSFNTKYKQMPPDHPIIPFYLFDAINFFIRFYKNAFTKPLIQSYIQSLFKIATEIKLLPFFNLNKKFEERKEKTLKSIKYFGFSI